MATPEKSIALLADLLSPSANASAIVYDPDEAAAENRTRLVPLTTIGEQRVFLVTGDPNGVQSASGPAIAITAAGALWIRPVATAGNAGWIQLIA